MVLDLKVARDIPGTIKRYDIFKIMLISRPLTIITLFITVLIIYYFQFFMNDIILTFSKF